jgi:UDP-3-O-[3-hydroxymyristoyl] N-acetylglucosamine deacetylase
MQRSIKNIIHLHGIGVHTGRDVRLTLRPAPIDHGIIFRRVDVVPHCLIPATIEAVHTTVLSTCIAANGHEVSTIEHLMAACYGMGIDNLLIDIDADEVPIMDGSAAPFVFALQAAGICEQAQYKKIMRIKEKVIWQEGDKWVSLAPYPRYRIDFSISFDHPAVVNMVQKRTYEFSSSTFMREISRARTFGFREDIDALHRKNLALGGSLDNVVVLDKQAIMNDGGLRLADEFVCHKILDVIGDLSLLGCTLLGCFTGHKSGHALNNKLLRALLAQPDAWEYVQPGNNEQPMDDCHRLPIVELSERA